MSFPANIAKHRVALLEMLEEAFRDPAKRSALKTRGISMEPLVRERDEVVIQAAALDSIAVGDLIAFRMLDALIVHRVAAITERGGRPLFYEKGDNNMYLTAVAPEAVLGIAVEILAAGRRLELRSPRFRRLGRYAAGYGLVAVKVYARLRGLGAQVCRPGSAASRAARAASYALLQLPIRVPLALARRLL